MTNVFDKMGLYWAEIADQNHTSQQIKFLKKQINPSEIVLDLACGTARHTIALTHAGFKVVGVDISPQLLKIARQRSAKMLVRGDVRFLPFKSGCFKSAFSMDTSIGYLSPEADAKIFSELKRVLKRGGIFIVDVFNRQHLFDKYQSDMPPVIKEYPTFTLHQKRSVNSKGNRLQDHWTITDNTNGTNSVFEHTVRLYKQSELEEMLETSGFMIETVFGNYEMEPLTRNSNQLILVASSSKV
jgi:ubiquinone/menaquinone biosynthesis C-methylase UbiE